MSDITKDTYTAYGERLKKEFGQLKKKPYTKVGITGEKAVAPHDEDEPQGATLAEVAVYNEFGTKTSPPRPFIRSTVEKMSSTWNQKGAQEVDAVLEGKRTFMQALVLMGERIKRDIQRTMRGNVPPPNAESTVDRKAAKARGGKKQLKAYYAGLEGQGTLRDTGLLLNSLTYSVHDDKSGD